MSSSAYRLRVPPAPARAKGARRIRGVRELAPAAFPAKSRSHLRRNGPRPASFPLAGRRSRRPPPQAWFLSDPCLWCKRERQPARDLIRASGAAARGLSDDFVERGQLAISTSVRNTLPARAGQPCRTRFGRCRISTALGGRTFRSDIKERRREAPPTAQPHPQQVLAFRPCACRDPQPKHAANLARCRPATCHQTPNPPPASSPRQSRRDTPRPAATPGHSSRRSRGFASSNCRNCTGRRHRSRSRRRAS